MRAVLAALCLCSACSYTTHYVAPTDGRARVVFKDGVAMVAGASQLVQDDCRYEVEELLRSRGQLPAAVVVAKPRVVTTTVVSSTAHGSSSSSSSGSGSGTKSSSSSAAALGRGAVVILLLAQVATVALVTAPSESPSSTSAAIDWANAFNDARTLGIPACGG
jgi:hypothetical protein